MTSQKTTRVAKRARKEAIVVEVYAVYLMIQVIFLALTPWSSLGSSGVGLVFVVTSIIVLSVALGQTSRMTRSWAIGLALVEALWIVALALCGYGDLADFGEKDPYYMGFWMALSSGIFLVVAAMTRLSRRTFKEDVDAMPVVARDLNAYSQWAEKWYKLGKGPSSHARWTVFIVAFVVNANLWLATNYYPRISALGKYTTISLAIGFVVWLICADDYHQNLKKHPGRARLRIEKEG